MAAQCTRRNLLAGAAGLSAAAMLGGCADAGRRDESRAAGAPPTGGAKAKAFQDVRIDLDTAVGREGFYHAARDTEGRWWLLRPDGRPFVYKGVCAVCDGYPGNDYNQTFRRVYGKPSRRFALDAFRILDDLGFNAFGMWCFIRNPRSGHERMGFPYVEYIHAREIYPKGTVSGPFCKTIDAFDPEWVKAYDAACAKRCTPHRDNTNLVGYYTDNEPFWAQPRLPKEQRKAEGKRVPVWGRDRLAQPTLLQVFLALPPGRPGHEAAWAFVLERHGGHVAEVARAWGADFSTREDLRRKTDEEKLILASAAYGRDHDGFTRLYVDTYFRVCAEAIRRHDPNHMILGVRHAGHWTSYGRPALESYGRNRRHVDVCSINTYRYRMHEPIAEYAGFMDMPILIGETGWGAWLAYDWPAPKGRYEDPVGWVKKEGVHQLARLVAHPQVTGYTWFKWYEGDDPHQPQVGVVTNDLVVNRVNASMFRRMHPVLEDVHAGAIAPDAV